MHSKKAYFQLILLQKLPKNLKANLEEAKDFSKRRSLMLVNLTPVLLLQVRFQFFTYQVLK